MSDTETTSDLLARLGVPTETRALATILAEALHAAATAPDEAHPAIARELEHEVTAKIHEGLAVYFDQSNGSIRWRDADLATMFAEQARMHRRIALGLQDEPAPMPPEIAAKVSAFARRIQGDEFPGVTIAPSAVAEADAAVAGAEVCSHCGGTSFHHTVECAWGQTTTEEAAFNRDRDEIVGYPAYSGGPES